MKFTHEGRRICLLGIQDQQPKCKQISSRKLKVLLRRGAVQQVIRIQPVHQEQDLFSLQSGPTTDTPLPTEIQEVLQEFQELFSPPMSLPPRRAHDHKIPLVPGAQPVSARP